MAAALEHHRGRLGAAGTPGNDEGGLVLPQGHGGKVVGFIYRLVHPEVRIGCGVACCGVAPCDVCGSVYGDYSYVEWRGMDVMIWYGTLFDGKTGVVWWCIVYDNASTKAP